MKLRAKANGDVLDVSDEEAETLLATGIYERVEESTAVEPLTTKDMPPLKNKARGKGKAK